MSRVNGQYIRARPRQFLRALQEIAGSSDGRADSQASMLVLCRARKLDLLLDVFYRNQALQIEIRIHHQKLFDTMPLQDFLRFFQRCAHWNGNEIVLGHNSADRLIQIPLKP